MKSILVHHVTTKTCPQARARKDGTMVECEDEIMSAPSKFGKNNKTTVEINLNVMPGRWKKLDHTR